MPLTLRLGFRSVVVLASCLAGLDGSAADLDKTQELFKKWAELRTEAGRLEADWEWQRGVLQSSQEALRHQVQRLEADLEQTNASQAAVRRTLAARREETEVLRKTLADIDHELRDLSTQAIALQRWLPPRLAAAIELPARSLANPDLPVTERMQHLASFQARCAQFNRLVTYSEEALMLPGQDRPRLVEIIYWGLAAAYALDRERDTAYTGFPGPDGWTWEILPDAATNVARLIAIHRDEVSPEFVSLPLRLQEIATSVDAKAAP